MRTKTPDYEKEQNHNHYLSGRSYGELYAKGLMEPEELENLSKQRLPLNWHIGFKEAAGYTVAYLVHGQ